MYSDDELNLAVEKGIFSKTSVNEFRDLMSQLKHSPSVDEENFRLIGGFNDIFIVIACALLLFSSYWVINSVTTSNVIGTFVFTILSWALAEFFVRKRRMALPAIVLLQAFVAGTFVFIYFLLKDIFQLSEQGTTIIAAAIATVAAYAHWLRFRVAITVAVGTATAIALIVSFVSYSFPVDQDLILFTLFICGLITFALAMYWDSSDTSRTTSKSDTAFWLHLLSAPLIIHPVFSSLGVFKGVEDIKVMMLVMVLYLLMTFISLVVDRRAFMISSLIYVLYALSSLLKTYGNIADSFALTGVFMGAMLLLLSAYWHPVRGMLLAQLPNRIRQLLPNSQRV